MGEQARPSEAVTLQLDLEDKLYVKWNVACAEEISDFSLNFQGKWG